MMVVATDDLPRGIRNHNPGNLKRGPAWRGLALVQSDPVFSVFIEPIYGLRALAKVLMRYHLRYGLTNVTGIISRYAPANENATQKYIEFVVSVLGKHDIQPAEFRATLPPLMSAIVSFENGQNPYPAIVYEDALILAEEVT